MSTRRNNLAHAAEPLERHLTWPPQGTHGSRTAAVRAIQRSQGKKDCFLSQERLLCGDEECEWRRECRRLVAVWKR